MRAGGTSWPRGAAPRDPLDRAPDIDDEGYPGLARYFASAGWAAAWVDMRGARASQGFFSIGGWVRDARATVDAARSIEGVSALPVALVGSSAGGAVAVEATRRGAPVDALALLAAPAAWLSFAHDTGDAVTRITEEAGMPLSPEVLADPAAWVSEFEQVVTEKAISSLRIPVLIVHGTDDDVVPVDHARRIADRACVRRARDPRGSTASAATSSPRAGGNPRVAGKDV